MRRHLFFLTTLWPVWDGLKKKRKEETLFFFLCFPRGIFGRNDLSPPGPRKKKKGSFFNPAKPPWTSIHNLGARSVNFSRFFCSPNPQQEVQLEDVPPPIKKKILRYKKKIFCERKKKYREGGRKLITPTRNGSTSAKLQHPELSDFFKSIFVRVKSLTRFHWNYSNFLRFFKKKKKKLDPFSPSSSRWWNIFLYVFLPLSTFRFHNTKKWERLFGQEGRRVDIWPEP